MEICNFGSTRTSMRVSTRQYAQALLTLGEGLDATQANATAKRFVRWLSRRGEAGKLGHILREADRLSCVREGRIEVSVMTPRHLDVATEEIVEKQASQIFPGKKIAVKYKLDEDLLGGVILQSEEMLYDASLSTAMKRLRATLVD